MQDAPKQVWIADMKPQGETWRKGFDEKPTGKFSHHYIGYTRTDLCVTEAECQRRVDAAVQAEREECAITADLYEDAEDAADAIRARGQK